ncbi:hypothetical protein K437DRAFT_68122 [Tilletiaria anomala UBC 951]|uniref:Uncharacterized protein n=1 Tax=Tilletiaria anomala (strain ATCC 24038 / CBS 436.72 / UBC 951) TaxID=1037660 RepID=A0A066VAG4_TILAU|nr:uncharacterized protein K437DRAFT_68122 [Tilletiaria anomala UBC 951]KDN35744.1 hypothetical protein K437DRAFT_68122 [Tilletiaria anomala UBC 951]
MISAMFTHNSADCHLQRAEYKAISVLSTVDWVQGLLIVIPLQICAVGADVASLVNWPSPASNSLLSDCENCYEGILQLQGVIDG